MKNPGQVYDNIKTVHLPAAIGYFLTGMRQRDIINAPV
jgi:hypothetical protein